jgi:hypothetical protein
MVFKMNTEIDKAKKDAEIEKKLETENGKDEKSLNLLRKKVCTLGLRDFYSLRKIWSWFIICCIKTLILAQIGFMICLGFGWLDFIKYKNVLTIFYFETFGQIIGLAVIVAKFLFRDKK